MNTTTSISDFGDVVMKNQSSSRSLLQQQSGTYLTQDICDNNYTINASKNILNAINNSNSKSSAVLTANQQLNTSKYKTELCRLFEEIGECKYGKTCQFAHGMPELRNLQRHPKYKTVYCREFHIIGICSYGRRCHFVHNQQQIECTQSNPQAKINILRYKTKLCRPFRKAGECRYGAKCVFAHGMHELRNLQHDSKYKTEYCRTFHSVGFCPYCPRCRDEASFQQQQQEQQQTRIAVTAAAAKTTFIK